MILRFALTILLITSYALAARSQSYEQRQDSIYKSQVTETYLYGVYIPLDINDAIKELNKKTSEAGQQKFASMDESLAANKLMVSLGRWMMINWQFYEGSRLVENLRSFGIYHPEDQARFIMRLYHRSLNHEPLQVEQLSQEIIAQRKEWYQNNYQVDTLMRRSPKPSNKE